MRRYGNKSTNPPLPPRPHGKLIDRKAVAKKLGCSTKEVQRLAAIPKNGGPPLVPSFMLGRQRRYEVAAVDLLIDRGANGGAA